MKRLLLVCLLSSAALGLVAANAARESGTSKVPGATFARALPGYRFSFPRDHASHPPYATEWWYFTGHLRAKDGRRFGYQLTFFRVALTPGIKRASRWATRDAIVGHFALTDISGEKFYFSETASRGAAGLAGASPSPAHIWLKDWDLTFPGGGLNQRFKAKGRSQGKGTAHVLFAVDLKTRASKKPVEHGNNGVSQKSEGAGQASHYYSFTRLATAGTIRIGDETLTVDGASWFDHEFGSSQLAKDQTGWDWFSLQLDDGRELMLYQLRTKDGGIDRYSSGTLIEKDGRARHLRRDEFKITPTGHWMSPSGTRYPAGWKVAVPGQAISLTVTPEMAEQELRTKVTGVNYWEGACKVSGSGLGQGYVELTGHDGTLAGKF